jgi:hypothetical protein
MITAKDILIAFNNYNFDEVINKEVERITEEFMARSKNYGNRTHTFSLRLNNKRDEYSSNKIKEGIINKLEDLGFKVNVETPEDEYSGILVKLEL